MATKKPKTSSNKKVEKKTTKSKTAAKTVEKPVSEAPITKQVETKGKTDSTFDGFFSRKYEGKESILTIFKNRKFYGALLGEIFGTAFITLMLFGLSLIGVHNIAPYAFAIIAIYIAVYAFSGACLNPILAVGMMASRRISVIRGIMYIIAEVVGAWIGWLIFNSFHLAGGENAYAVPTMTQIGENQFWLFAMVELLGAIIIAYFYARAVKYKRSVFTFAAVAVGGIVVATFVGYIVSAAFLTLNNNFIFNPAAALMYQIFPTSGENFGEIFGGICQALSVYVLLPMAGGAVGFFFADFTSRLSGEE